MDERLSLGIPDRSAIDAPARRFALIEERSRVSSIVPAILVASWGLLLKQVFGSGNEETPRQPKADSPGSETAQPETEAAAAPSTAERTPGSSELVRAFGLASVSTNEAFEPAVDLDKLKFAKTDGPRLSLVPANQNVPAVARPQPLAGEANPSRRRRLAVAEAEAVAAVAAVEAGDARSPERSRQEPRRRSEEAHAGKQGPAARRSCRSASTMLP